MTLEPLIGLKKTAEKSEIAVKAGGEDVTRKAGIFSFIVTREANRLPFARLWIRQSAVKRSVNPEPPETYFTPGQEIEILAGPLSGKQSIFKGIVTKLSLKIQKSGESKLVVECRDHAGKMTVGRKNKYFAGMKDSDILAAIINEYGLAAEIDDTPEVHETMVQYDATDWDFLLARARANGLQVIAEGGALRIQAPQLEATGQLPVCRFGANLVALDLEMDVRTQFAGAKAKSWSAADQALIEAEGEDPGWTGPGTATATDLAAVIGLEGLDLRHTGGRTDQELQKWAAAGLLHSRLAKIRGWVEAKGDATINPGALLDLQGVDPRFAGAAFVSGVRHEWGRSGWVTHLQLGLPAEVTTQIQEDFRPYAAGLLPGIPGLQIGVVTQLKDDPKGEDRILVKAPIIDDQAEGIWARIATLDAGNGRGSFFRPEIGDEVVLGFLNDDPRDAIVLGMLNSSAKPAPVQATDENHEKGFYTRDGIKLVFNDDRKSLTIETPKGKKVIIDDKAGTISLQNGTKSKVTLQQKKISLECNGDIAIKASGGNIRLEGNNVEVKAQAQFKAAGNGGAEVSTSGVAVLKGSLVQIN